eukprot:5368226-Pleurochrysis_carterae.AAC.1
MDTYKVVGKRASASYNSDGVSLYWWMPGFVPGISPLWPQPSDITVLKSNHPRAFADAAVACARAASWCRFSSRPWCATRRRA